jgi:hypothetical protein
MFGGRYERARFDPAQDSERARSATSTTSPARSPLRRGRTDQVTVAFSPRVPRAATPALEVSCYFHGPSPGNNAIENGNADRESERPGLGFDGVRAVARRGGVG